MNFHHYEPSNKATESTVPFNQLPNRYKEPEDKELYKEDSQQSDEPIIKPNIKEQFSKKQPFSEHEEIRKFLKKADEINQINYKKLQKGKPSFPANTNSIGTLYKSSKNILEELGSEKDQKIKQTYLPHRKQVKKHTKILKKKNEISVEKKKVAMSTKQVQTEKEEQAIKKNERYLNNSSSKALNLNPIKEDKDEDHILQQKKRRKINSVNYKKVFNTISLTSEIPKKWEKKYRIENEVGKKYSVKKEHKERTVFHNVEKDQNQIANKTYVNFWENQKTEEKQPEKKPVHRKLSPLNKEKKKTESKRKTQSNKPSMKSLIVQENNSVKVTEPTDLILNKESNLYSSKLGDLNQNKQISIQFPEVSELVVGAQQSEVQMKPTHPIKIDFAENDALWITQNYNPKSQFLRKIDLKNFQIKKYKNGVYFGQISEDGLKHGKGVVFYFNGRSYEGKFNNDIKEGKGYEYFPDGSTYVGDFKDGYKEGKGIFQWPNGQVYDGQWQAGKKNGSGMWKGPNGDSYIGEWKKGKVQGFGVFVSKGGDRYEGQFKNSMKHGLGTERYENGDTYVGLFSKNRPNGQGQVYYRNGDYFKGNFSNGLRHGNGIMKEENGVIFKGQYRNDKRCGLGELTTEEGETYVGNFENDLKHGYGEIHENFEVLKGFWMNNERVDETGTPIQEKDEEFKRNFSRKKKLNKKSPKNDRKKSIEKSLSPGMNNQRACGCKRKH